MDQILEGLGGVVNIADDIAVYGQNNEDHDKNLHNIMICTTETNLVFNSEKYLIKQTSISFFGNIYTPTRIKPYKSVRWKENANPTKQEGATALPWNARLLLSKLAEKAHPLRGLLKSQLPWAWNPDHQKCYDYLKEMISGNTCFSHYETNQYPYTTAGS